MFGSFLYTLYNRADMPKMKPHEDEAFTATPQPSACLSPLPAPRPPFPWEKSACCHTAWPAGVHVAGCFAFRQVSGSYSLHRPFLYASAIFSLVPKYSEKIIFYIMHLVLIPNSRTLCGCFFCCCIKSPRPPVLLLISLIPMQFSLGLLFLLSLQTHVKYLYQTYFCCVYLTSESVSKFLVYVLNI